MRYAIWSAVLGAAVLATGPALAQHETRADPQRDARDDARRRRRSAGIGGKPECRASPGMGYALSELGRWDEAVEVYKKCLKLDRNDAKARGELEWIAEQRSKKS